MRLLQTSTLNPNLMKPFHQPLCKTTNTNLTLHTNAMKRNPTIGGHQRIYKVPQEDNLYESQKDNLYKDNFYKPQEDNKDTSSVSIVKNYYITTEHVNIN
ncbi:16300_t:CDS:2 [Dentiscutata erythropus]|uniref:16300_t:CDS:1 n=1 Tax=Dentiscutata erythropus TaxID=1348616 RepID=A0A9N9CTM0_9GLOM|nr:16300_t:CDS:2 [Dentiscutata erythropus]